MPTPFSSFDQRQWTQIRAALKFWNLLAEISAKHPSRHPDIEPMFHSTAPLTIPEIDALLTELPSVLYVTTGDVARAAGLATATVTKWVKEAGLKPAFTHGKLRVYYAADLEQLVRAHA